MCNHKKKLKLNKYIWQYNWKWQQHVVSPIISQIANKLKQHTLFDLFPTIDCFGNKQTKVNMCQTYIQGKDDFFSSKYDEQQIWNPPNIAWCTPPISIQIIHKTIDKIISRKMCAYLLIRYFDNQMCWLQATISIAKNKCTTWTQITGQDIKPFHGIFAMYFNGRNKLQNT